jgi:hypothetical protein
VKTTKPMTDAAIAPPHRAQRDGPRRDPPARQALDADQDDEN